MAYQQIEKSNPAFTQKDLCLLTIHASSIQGRANVSVYNAYSQAKNLPIVILLHGVYGNNWVWMNLGGAHMVYECLRQATPGLTEMVLVMPSDGNYFAGSAYLPLQDKGNYEAWIIDDMLDATIATIDCVSNQSNIYIAGLSMGGYGALRLGAKYPSKFAGIAAHSAITQLEQMSEFVKEPLSHYLCQEKTEASILHWAQINRASLPPIRFDCGTNDSLLAGNRLLSKQLEQLNISHIYEECEGQHSWDYWNTQLAHTLQFFNRIETGKNELKNQ
ncbi:ATPase [Saccharophagus degradans]|uniref:alpha/beta hydrolase n=1 Tax=Saccharophagus degradans TaxID=86304 RepID=UPI001C0A56C1|nr:alpha/beta hydrolase-fold protein [Saccharophagus degradans]MBU2984664.1 ATPase [Saccharophagus degradans]